MDSLPDPAIDDLVLDFIEQRLGRFHAVQNWKRLERTKSTLQSVVSWLKDTGNRSTNAQELSDAISAYIATRPVWLN